MEIAGRVNEAIRQHLPDAVFIDAGGPNAGGVVDRLRLLNPQDEPNAVPIFEINFGSKSPGMTAAMGLTERVRVANKRAQMWQNMKVWLERGSIPDTQELRDDLIGPEYAYNADQAIQLEKKEHMKARGLASPDEADALALTFAEDVAPKVTPNYLNPENYPGSRSQDYDRYAELPGYQAHQRGEEYDRYAE